MDESQWRLGFPWVGLEYRSACLDGLGTRDDLDDFVRPSLPPFGSETEHLDAEDVIVDPSG
jgi:hypothetical protein